AGARGLPFVASYHITPATALEAIDAYRAAFVPSATLERPYVVVSADIVVADDSATARHLATGYGHWVYSIRTGVGAAPYPDPDDCPALTDEQLPVVKDRLETQFVGNPDEVADRLSALQRVTCADELVVTSVTHRHEDRLRSHELIAERWGGTVEPQTNSFGGSLPERGQPDRVRLVCTLRAHRGTQIVRLLLSGRRSRRGRPAGRLHRAGGPGRRHRPDRADRYHQHHLQRTIRSGQAIRHPRPSIGWPRRLEHRHFFARVHRRQLPA